MNQNKRDGVDSSAFSARTRERSFLLSLVLTTAKMLFFIVLLLGVTATGLLVGVAKAWVETTPELDLSRFNRQAQTSFIYDKNGNRIGDYRGIENRVDAKYSEFPKNLINAVVATEDQRFWAHDGVDFRRLVSAAITTVTGTSDQGGSTISQQVIKKIILTDDQTFKRKLQEAYLAIQLESVITKEQILEEYLNIIYLGGSNYGVKVAAQDYFGKELHQLTLRECAALARCIRNPAKYNPRTCYYKTSPDTIEKETNYVLGLMLDQGLITQGEYTQAYSERLSVLQVSPNAQSGLSDQLYYSEYAIYDVVTKMLRVEGLSDTKSNRSKMETKLRTGGYRVYTALDPAVQEAVQSVVRNWDKYPKTRKSSDSIYNAPLGNGQYLQVPQPQVAVTVIDWRTGEIVANVGGREIPTAQKQLNRTYQMNMPVGSSIKPLSVYGPAFDLGYSPGSPVINAPIRIRGWDSQSDIGYPSNYGGGQFTGMESMREAIVTSHNTAAAHALYNYVTIDNSIAYLRKLGVSEKHIMPTGFGLALGSSGISMVEMAAAFGAIANGGVYLEPLAFKAVLNPDDSVYIDSQDVQIVHRVFKESTAWMLVDVLKEAVRSGTGTRAKFGNITVAGKTGTNSDYCGCSFAGMTGYLSAAVWIGHENYKPLVTNATGGEYAAPLWAAIMKEVHAVKGYVDDHPIQERSAEQVGLVRREACGVSGMIPNDACRNDINNYGTTYDWYLVGTEPSRPCNMHRAIRVCSRTRMAPTSSCPTMAMGGLYLPDGHPLRNDSAEVVREYFQGATTNKAGAVLGTCTQCGGGRSNNDRRAVLGYAARGIEEADNLMRDGNVSPADHDDIKAARDALQKAVNEDVSTDEIAALVSVVKRVNEGVKAKLQ